MTSKPPAAASGAARRPARRRFLLGGLGAAGALIVGWGFLPPRQRLHADHPMPLERGEAALNGWIKIRYDGTVTVAMPRSEMGQGVHTALAMLVAEELDVPLARVRVVPAPHDKIFGNVVTLPDGLPFRPDDDSMLRNGVHWLAVKLSRELGLHITGGSTSVRDAWLPMREAGASARAMLVAAAARQWGVDPAECRTADGMVRHGRDNAVRSLSYGALAADATAHPPSDAIRLKQPREFRLIGTQAARTDSRAKSDGSAQFGIDARPKGLQYAAVVMSPTPAGTLAGLDDRAARRMPGVIRVVNFSDRVGELGVQGVAVIASSWWQARQACDRLKIDWDLGDDAALSSQAVERQLREALDTQTPYDYYRSGDGGKPPAGARQVAAEYFVPFLAHATMEPVNCTAQVSGGKATVWVGSQVPGLARKAAARAAGLAEDDVTLHLAYLGGGFGRRLEVDMVTQAAAIAREAGGVPVQLIWTREQDIAHDMYRPMALARFRAALGAGGEVLGWDNVSASGSITHQAMRRTFGLAGMGPDKTQVEGEFDLPYEIANQRVGHVNVPSRVPLGYWRSVGHSHNAFFTESFIDELAHTAGQDPAAFRRALLRRHPRHLAVLDAVTLRAGTPPAGRAHGLALHQSFGSIVAQVAEVSAENGAIRVHKVWCAIDCGLAVNPNIIAQQMESGIVFGLSAALAGRITFEGGKPQQGNFHDYPVLRMQDTPAVETIVMPSAHPPGGVGEPGTPPIAPAVANAVFKLTGKRLRSLPLVLG